MTIKPVESHEYVDDIFCIVPRSEIDNVLKIFNAYNNTIEFTYEVEKDRQLNFLDKCTYVDTDNKIKANWYQKFTYTDTILLLIYT